MTTIVLKDSLGVDQTFTFTTVSPNGDSVFVRQSGPLLGRAELRLAVGGNTNVNRVKAKLSLPVVCAADSSPGSCPTTMIKYTQVGSTDITVVKQSSEVERQDLNAMLKSLAGNPVVEQLVINGIIPRA